MPLIPAEPESIAVVRGLRQQFAKKDGRENLSLADLVAPADTGTADWIGAGLAPWIMIHCPNNLHCPPLALDFHERVRQRTDMPALPRWPVKSRPCWPMRPLA